MSFFRIDQWLGIVNRLRLLRGESKSRIRPVVTQEQVIGKLRECLDPELGVNIVDLGLVYGVTIEGSRIQVLMTLTTPGCPLDSYFTKDISDKLKKLKGISDVSVELTFEPPWSPAKMSAESRDLLGFVN